MPRGPENRTFAPETLSAVIDRSELHFLQFRSWGMAVQ